MVLGVPILKHFRVGCLRKCGGRKIDSELFLFFLLLFFLLLKKKSEKLHVKECN